MALVKYNNNSISAVTSTGLASGSLVHIKTLTASSSGTLSFVHGSNGVVLDSTYPIYKFELINIHAATADANFRFNTSPNGGSNYNVVKTTTFFRATHNEAGNDSGLEYRASQDLAQSTAAQIILQQIGNDNDQSGSGTLTLYNPSSTTFAKHFIVRVNTTTHNDQCISDHIAGYFNNTNDINAVQFKMSSGNFDGVIKLYGVS